MTTPLAPDGLDVVHHKHGAGVEEDGGEGGLVRPGVQRRGRGVGAQVWPLQSGTEEAQRAAL